MVLGQGWREAQSSVGKGPMRKQEDRLSHSYLHMACWAYERSSEWVPNAKLKED